MSKPLHEDVWCIGETLDETVLVCFTEHAQDEGFLTRLNNLVRSVHHHSSHVFEGHPFGQHVDHKDACRNEEHTPSYSQDWSINLSDTNLYKKAHSMFTFHVICVISAMSI